MSKGFRTIVNATQEYIYKANQPFYCNEIIGEIKLISKREDVTLGKVRMALDELASKGIVIKEKEYRIYRYYPVAVK